MVSTPPAAKMKCRAFTVRWPTEVATSSDSTRLPSFVNFSPTTVLRRLILMRSEAIIASRWTSMMREFVAQRST